MVLESTDSISGSKVDGLLSILIVECHQRIMVACTDLGLLVLLR